MQKIIDYPEVVVDIEIIVDIVNLVVFCKSLWLTRLWQGRFNFPSAIYPVVRQALLYGPHKNYRYYCKVLHICILRNNKRTNK